jgi:hypothetical protein
MNVIASLPAEKVLERVVGDHILANWNDAPRPHSNRGSRGVRSRHRGAGRGAMNAAQLIRRFGAGLVQHDEGSATADINPTPEELRSLLRIAELADRLLDEPTSLVRIDALADALGHTDDVE